MSEANAVTQQNTNAQPQEQHVIASPNPTVDDSKTPAAVDPKSVSSTKVRPAAATTAAPLKKTTRHKSKRRRTKPHHD